MLELTEQEWIPLKSKFLTSIKGGKTKLPTAFTEKGLYMLATILKSPEAVQTTIAIIEAFANLKELARTTLQLSAAQTEEQRVIALKKGTEIIADLLDNELVLSQKETSFEINLPLFKFKHTIRKEKK